MQTTTYPLETQWIISTTKKSLQISTFLKLNAILKHSKLSSFPSCPNLSHWSCFPPAAPKCLGSSSHLPHNLLQWWRTVPQCHRSACSRSQTVWHRWHRKSLLCCDSRPENVNARDLLISKKIERQTCLFFCPSSRSSFVAATYSRHFSSTACSSFTCQGKGTIKSKSYLSWWTLNRQGQAHPKLKPFPAVRVSHGITQYSCPGTPMVFSENLSY